MVNIDSGSGDKVNDLVQQVGLTPLVAKTVGGASDLALTIY